MALTLSQQEILSFDGRHRVFKISGPLTHFRFCGRTTAGAASNPYGRFWFNEKFFLEMVEIVSESSSNNAQLNHYMRYILREFTSVCYDWNSFASIYQLKAPKHMSVEVAAGRIAPQPFYSNSDPQNRKPLAHELLVGGEFQYIIDMSNNTSLKQYAQGPRPLWLHHGVNA